MGVSILYNAIPPESPLHRRIQQDKSFCILLVSLFPYGNGIFNLFEMDPEEVHELFTDVIEEHHETFGLEVEVDQIIAEFQSEIGRTRQAHPGIEDRTASLEKTSVEIEERLLQELLRRQVPNPHEVVQRLIFGDQDLPPNLLPEESFGLISREAVREGASILRQISPETLFTTEDHDEWYLEQFENWKELYFLVDARGEEILVGVA